MLDMEDEAGMDSKVLAVPTTKIKGPTLGDEAHLRDGLGLRSLNPS